MGLCQSQHGQGLLARDALKIIQKVFQRLPGCQAIKEGPDRDARMVKAGCSTDTLWIDPDQPEKRMAGLNLVADKVFRTDWVRMCDQRLLCGRRHRISIVSV